MEWELILAVETDYMEVPFTVMGLIIGRNGDNLRHLQEIFNVTIRVCVYLLY